MYFLLPNLWEGGNAIYIVCIHIYIHIHIGFPGESVVKNLLANAGDTEDVGSIPGSGRFPGGGNDSPL